MKRRRRQRLLFRFPVLFHFPVLDASPKKHLREGPDGGDDEHGKTCNQVGAQDYQRQCWGHRYEVASLDGIPSLLSHQTSQSGRNHTRNQNNHGKHEEKHPEGKQTSVMLITLQPAHHT